jgi:hypothetical protein
MAAGSRDIGIRTNKWIRRIEMGGRDRSIVRQQKHIHGGGGAGSIRGILRSLFVKPKIREIDCERHGTQ